MRLTILYLDLDQDQTLPHRVGSRQQPIFATHVLKCSTTENQIYFSKRPNPSAGNQALFQINQIEPINQIESITQSPIFPDQMANSYDETSGARGQLVAVTNARLMEVLVELSYLCIFIGLEILPQVLLCFQVMHHELVVHGINVYYSIRFD